MSSSAGRNVRTVPIAREATCKRCGATGLGWLQNAQGKWHLINVHSVDGELCAVPGDYHCCDQHRAVQAQVSRENEQRPLRAEKARLEAEGRAAMIRQDWEEAGRLLLQAKEIGEQIEAAG
jgi:hypothetical protein